MDMKQMVELLYKKYENEITSEELEYYRRNMKPSRLHQLMIEIYFFNYTGSSQEFTLLRNLDWHKLLLILRKDLMRRFNITKDIRAIVYSNVYNLTNTEYIADAKDGTNHDWKTALVYYGFGTTWSAGFKVIF